MRKLQILIIVTALFVTPALNAQIKKGSVFLGGDIGGSIQKVKRDGVAINSQRLRYFAGLW